MGIKIGGKIHKWIDTKRKTIELLETICSFSDFCDNKNYNLFSDDIDISFNERILDEMGDTFFYLGFDRRKNIIEFLDKNKYLIDCIKNKGDIFIYKQPVIIFIYMTVKEDYRLIDEVFTKIVNVAGMSFYKQIEYLFNDLGFNPTYEHYLIDGKQ